MSYQKQKHYRIITILELMSCKHVLSLLFSLLLSASFAQEVSVTEDPIPEDLGKGDYVLVVRTYSDDELKKMGWVEPKVMDYYNELVAELFEEEYPGEFIIVSKDELSELEMNDKYRFMFRIWTRYKNMVQAGVYDNTNGYTYIREKAYNTAGWKKGLKKDILQVVESYNKNSTK